jgi:hypothetical protein
LIASASLARLIFFSRCWCPKYALPFDWPFSFSNICDQIKLDKDVVRAGLLRWKHRLAATASELDENSSDGKNARAAYQRRALVTRPTSFRASWR